mmetsp:Transcript_9563/g.31706  ORF Transcript_9563/g.31706 Transcript_9563/m.31706 type:complete len:245 (+) Transcript_9563:717-1451(+)
MATESPASLTAPITARQSPAPAHQMRVPWSRTASAHAPETRAFTPDAKRSASLVASNARLKASAIASSASSRRSISSTRISIAYPDTALPSSPCPSSTQNSAQLASEQNGWQTQAQSWFTLCWPVPCGEGSMPWHEKEQTSAGSNGSSASSASSPSSVAEHRFVGQSILSGEWSSWNVSGSAPLLPSGTVPATASDQDMGPRGVAPIGSSPLKSFEERRLRKVRAASVAGASLVCELVGSAIAS